MGLERAITIAIDLGCEAQANGIRSLQAYRDELGFDPREEIAIVYGASNWWNIPAADWSQILKAFREGKQREKSYQSHRE